MDTPRTTLFEKTMAPQRSQNETTNNLLAKCLFLLEVASSFNAHFDIQWRQIQTFQSKIHSAYSYGPNMKVLK